MDNVVGLVRAYLHLNGHFTVTEFPVVEALDGGGYRTATDLDVLAFRFARAASDPSTHGREGVSGDEPRFPDSFRFLESHIHRHWDLLHQVQSKDPAFGLLLTLEKARRATKAPETPAPRLRKVGP